MFKKMLAMLFIAVVLMALPTGAYAAAEPYVIDRSSLDKGIITIHYTGNTDTKAIVRITKGDDTSDYNLANGARYPLQWGNGVYNVLIAQFISDNKYRVVGQERIELKMTDANEVFLQPIQLVDWNGKTRAVAETAKLTEDAVTDKEKAEAIYSYITHTIRYDNEKARSVTTAYLPDLDTVYDTAEGICYDYAALFAAMARSQHIPTRLVMGYAADAPDVYHAWNQIYLQDSGQWVTIDTTYDAARVQKGQAPEMIKDSADYTIAQIY
ncbi:Transglutaminase-like superfamily protein [Paenibacillus konkukensis]|uniref:Transglutaminase-like superfamily protein n=1 Tax=Paenibacillus konkukensis TaxID=2020716 RepID=A0ABY4RM92_9BACL|nr:transglutaminase-like domain-containing protein [Paenibacillus konkukensis]UQZ82976.1 Transglutaminase-like superfamily protein [Paenibacillus konkukensis]